MVLLQWEVPRFSNSASLAVSLALTDLVIVLIFLLLLLGLLLPFKHSHKQLCKRQSLWMPNFLGSQIHRSDFRYCPSWLAGNWISSSLRSQMKEKKYCFQIVEVFLNNKWEGDGKGQRELINCDV